MPPFTAALALLFLNELIFFFFRFVYFNYEIIENREIFIWLQIVIRFQWIFIAVAAAIGTGK